MAVEVGERTVLHTNNLAHFKKDLGPWFFNALLHLGHDLIDLGLRDGRRLASRAPKKAGDLVGVFNQMPALIVHVHFNKHIARKEPAL